MERKLTEIQGIFAQPVADPMLLWATCLVRRKSENKNLRNIKPMMVRIVKKEDVGRYNATSYNVYDMNNKQIKAQGNAWGTELHLFDTEQEAVDYYNNNVVEIMDMINRSIVKLEKEKIKAEALRIGR